MFPSKKLPTKVKPDKIDGGELTESSEEYYDCSESGEVSSMLSQLHVSKTKKNGGAKAAATPMIQKKVGTVTPMKTS